MLTDKCLEDFKDWLESNDVRTNCIEDSLVKFFTENNLSITIDNEDEVEWWYCIQNCTFVKGVSSIYGNTTNYKSKEEALAKALERANNIYNNRKN